LKVLSKSISQTPHEIRTPFHLSLPRSQQKEYIKNCQVKKDENSKKKTRKRAELSPVFFIQHAAQCKGKSARG